MSRSLIYLVAGARPNFMKIAPIVRALQARADRFEFKIIHTGQHYDREMSDVFFDELGIPKPDYHLDAGGAGLETEALKQQFPRYGVVTLHRPSNVDDEATLHGIAGALRDIAAELPLIFPVHPRTRGNLEKFGLDLGPNVHLIKPQGYMAFLNLWKDAALILTDSGGLQEETTALGVPCLTLRENTERPVTIDEGSNVLVGTDPARIREEAARVLAGQGKQGRRPALWDGKAAERIVAELDRLIQG